MLNEIIIFFAKNWLDILLVVVGASAFIIYWLQRRRKASEAASLIILQVEDLQKRIAEIGSFIVNGELNDGAFYESQMLFKTDYWNEYKHYFVRKIDAFSFSTFDEFYNCASEILEQQQLMKNLQKNSLFLTQQMIMQMETNAAIQSLSLCEKSPIDMTQLVKAVETTLPNEIGLEQKNALENMIKQIGAANPNFDMNAFWSLYNRTKGNIHMIINKNALTHYIPVQIKITLENALKKYNAIPIFGCEGYRKIKKIGERKF